MRRWRKTAYTNVCLRNGKVCGINRFNFTFAIVVGLDEAGYERRYCYERRLDAHEALGTWDGVGHPPGPWIKCKGAGVDLLNPKLD